MKDKQRFDELDQEIKELESQISQKREELYSLYDPEDFTAMMEGEDPENPDYLTEKIFPDNE